MTLEELNTLPEDALVAELLRICHSQAFAEGVARRRPYASLDALQAEADAVWMALGPDDWREALDGHPRIGETGGAAPSWSAGEQAGVTTADGAVQDAIAAGNAEYEQRFGHVFLISAAGRSAGEILDTLQARLGNDPATELAVAAEEHRRITRLRLERLVAA